MDSLITPLTEIEKAELLSAASEVLTKNGLLKLRRLMYEVDQLRMKVTNLRSEIDNPRRADNP